MTIENLKNRYNAVSNIKINSIKNGGSKLIQQLVINDNISVLVWLEDRKEKKKVTGLELLGKAKSQDEAAELIKSIAFITDAFCSTSQEDRNEILDKLNLTNDNGLRKDNIVKYKRNITENYSEEYFIKTYNEKDVLFYSIKLLKINIKR